MTNLEGDDLERYERRLELERQIAAGGDGANMTWLKEALQVAIGAQATELGRLTRDISKRHHKLRHLRKDLAKVEQEREALLAARNGDDTVPSTPKIDYQAITVLLSDASAKIKRLKSKIYWAETWDKEHSAAALSRLATLVAHTAPDPEATAVPIPKTAAYRALTKGQRKAARRAYMPTALASARTLLRKKGYATGTTTTDCHVGDGRLDDRGWSDDDSWGDARGSELDPPFNGPSFPKSNGCRDTPPITTVKLEEPECATNLSHTAQPGPSVQGPPTQAAPTHMAIPASHIVIGDDKMQVTLPQPDQPYVWKSKKRVMVNGSARDICVEEAVSIKKPSSDTRNVEPGLDRVKREAEVMAADHQRINDPLEAVAANRESVNDWLNAAAANRKREATKNKAPTQKQMKKQTQKKQKQKEAGNGAKGVKAGLQVKKEHE